MDVYFFLILGIATVFGIAFIIGTKGIYYNTPDTDNELMAYAAAQSHKWRWPSDVHKYSASTRKVSTKEWTIILLSIFQKIFKDKTTDWPYTAMTGIAVSVSTILIFLIASNYFNPMIGLIVAILYIVSFWPWQVSLYGGHANIANLFFLLSTYSIQISSNFSFSHFILIIVGGAFLGFSIFSSPSSHKYFITIFAALFFNEYRVFFASNDIDSILNTLPLNHLLLLDGAIMASFLLANLVVASAYKPLVKTIYAQKAPIFLNKIMSGRDHFTVEHYVGNAKKKILRIRHWVFWILFSLLLAINLIPTLTLMAFVVGFVCIFFIINLPNVKESSIEYLACLLDHKRKTHFKGYENYFAKRGIMVQHNTRGAGLSWVPKMLWIFAPFHATFFVVAFIMGQYKSLIVGNITESISLTLVALISLSTIIWAEITKAPQISRLYSPSLITGLLLPAYVLSGITWTSYSLFIFLVMGICVFTWNLWRFTNDIYPARMTVRNLTQIIHKLGINKIYTYRTSLNSFLVDAIPGIGKSEYLPKQNIVPPFHVQYIKQLDEVINGWIAIPGKTRLAVTLTGENMSDDLTRDPILNRLIETRQIEQVAMAKLKTYITSTIWVNEDDITSYCALHLKDFKEDDLYRGYAWLIHSSKLSNLKHN